MDDSLQSNISALQTIWKRHTFHDAEIDSIQRLRGRVIVTLRDYHLVLTGVSHYSEDIEELPTSWISQRIELKGNHAVLSTVAEVGSFTVTFANLRLIRRSDLSVLVPALDRA
jgi:hypothetical protein